MLRKGMKVAAVFCAVCLAGVGAGGCSAPQAQETPLPVIEVTTMSPTQTPVPAPTTEPSAEPSYITLGSDTTGAFHVLMTNNTAGDIVGLQIKESEAKDYEPQLLANEQGVGPGETFDLYYHPENMPDALDEPVEDGTVSPEGRTEWKIPTYDMYVVCSDDTQFVLYDLPFDDMNDTEILFSPGDNVGYVRYRSIETGEMVNTLEAQLMRSIAGETPSASAQPAKSADRVSSSPAPSASASASSSAGPSGGRDEESASPSDAAAPSSSDGGGDSEPDHSADHGFGDDIVWND